MRGRDMPETSSRRKLRNGNAAATEVEFGSRERNSPLYLQNNNSSDLLPTISYRISRTAILQTFLYLYRNCRDAADGRLISRPSLSPACPHEKKSHPASKLVPLDPPETCKRGNNDTAIISCAAAVHTL